MFKVIDRVRYALYKHYVPLHIGAGAWNAERIEDRTPEFVRVLYKNKRIGGVGDASYTWREKNRAHLPPSA